MQSRDIEKPSHRLFYTNRIRRIAALHSDHDRTSVLRIPFECAKHRASRRLQTLRLVPPPLTYRFTLCFPGACLALALSGSPIASAGSSGAITLSGSVEAHCEISSPATSADLGALNGVGSKELRLTYTCNTPFAYQIQSANGGLKHNTLEAQTGFLNSLAYTVQVHLPTDVSPISQTVSSREIVAGSATTFANSGSAIAINKTGTLTLNWDAPEFATATPLLAGDYGDHLTLTFSAQQ